MDQMPTLIEINKILKDAEHAAKNSAQFCIEKNSNGLKVQFF
jgi:hypothetical protein